jgi:putative thioredoxin
VVNAPPDGRVRLVKIDIDKNRGLVQQLVQMGLPLQSVPTVVAFWKGQILDLFQGALPELEVKRFIEGLKQAGGQMPTADLLGEAKAALEEGDATTALQMFGALAQREPESAEAMAGVARCLMALGQEEQALQVIESVPESSAAMPRSLPSGAPWNWPRKGAKRGPSSRNSKRAWPLIPMTTRRGLIWPSR